MASATLRVRVGHSTTPGTLPATPPGPTPTPSSPVPTATPDPFDNVTVRVVRADAPTKVVGERHTDALGFAVFTLLPGHYWAYVPSEDPAAFDFCGPVKRACGYKTLPDSRPVYAFRDATLSAGQITVLTLTITNLLAP